VGPGRRARSSRCRGPCVVGGGRRQRRLGPLRDPPTVGAGSPAQSLTGRQTTHGHRVEGPIAKLNQQRPHHSRPDTGVPAARSDESARDHGPPVVRDRRAQTPTAYRATVSGGRSDLRSRDRGPVDKLSSEDLPGARPQDLPRACRHGGPPWSRAAASHGREGAPREGEHELSAHSALVRQAVSTSACWWSPAILPRPHETRHGVAATPSVWTDPRRGWRSEPRSGVEVGAGVGIGVAVAVAVGSGCSGIPLLTG
jgi:hypothetical protein